jgi:hypothetical protein
MTPLPNARPGRPRTAAAAIAAIAAMAAACQSTTERAPDYAPREVVELDRFEIFEGGVSRGFVVHLEIRDPQGPIPYYRIEDLRGRWIGHATVQGRFSRRVPFDDREEDLGVWSMQQGVARLLDASAPVELRRIAVDADARRRGR